MKVISTISKFFKQKGLLFTDQAMVSGCNFIIGILLARFLGLVIFGEFVIAWMLILIFSSIQLSGILDALFTLSGKRSTIRQVKFIVELSKLNLIYAAAAFCVAIVTVFGYSIYTKTNVDSYLVTIPIIVFLYLLLDFIRKVFMVRKKYAHLIIIDFIANVLQVVLIVGLCLIDILSVSNYLWGVIICYAFSVFVALWLNSEFLVTGFIFPIQKTTILEVWQFSKYLVFTAVLQWFSGNYFIVLGAAIIGVKTAGIIKIVQNLMGVLNILLTVLENFIPFSAAQLLKLKGIIAVKQYFKKIYTAGIIGVLLLIGLIAFNSEYIIQVTYGAAFIKYHSILTLFSCMYILVFTGTILRFIIKTLECNHSIFLGYILSTIFSLLFAKSIITNYGLEGIVFGLFLTQIISVALYAIFVHLKLNSYENSSLYTR